MRNTKTRLLASAAVMALALGMASPAKAFDDVDWAWTKDVTSIENITITVNDTFDWSGLVEIEKIQTNIGDVTATSTVTGITNTPPGEAGAGGQVLATINTPVSLTAAVDSNQPNNPITSVIINGGSLVASNGSGNVDENANEVNLLFDVSGQILVDIGDVVLEGENDALDLPEVVSAATAVANNQAIDSTSAVNLHDAQFNFGGFGTPNPQLLALVGYADQTDNPHTDAALGLTIAGALGLITQGSVTATSTVTDILNASVDSSATAVGNNISVNVEPATEGDAFLIADLTQFNYANTTATSSVTDVDIENYTNFGGAGFGNCGGCVDEALDGVQTALVSSVATAVGNNVSISVGNFSDLGE